VPLPHPSLPLHLIPGWAKDAGIIVKLSTEINATKVAIFFIFFSFATKVWTANLTTTEIALS
jgi:hypothetical protein